MFGILDVHTDPNTRKLHTNAVYQDKTQLANFQGNLPYPATKRHLTVKRRKTTITRRTDVDACDCTRELCCTDTASESALEADTGRKKKSLPARGLEPEPVLRLAFQSDAVPVTNLPCTLRRSSWRADRNVNLLLCVNLLPSTSLK